MTRSSRLLAVGLTVIVVGIVVLMLALNNDEPVVVDGDGVAATAVSTETDALGAVEGVAAPVDEVDLLPLPLVIPDGHEAVTVTLDFTRGAAKLPVPGDHINVYGIFADVPEELLGADQLAVPEADREPIPGVMRAVSNVEVLGITAPPVDQATGQTTFVLALEPDDAERVIFYASHAAMWFTMVPEDASAVAGEGITLQNVLG